MNYLIIVVFFLAVVGLNWWLRFDVDERQKGEPMRDWKAKATYPKSWVHAVQAFALMMLCFALGLHVIAAAVLVFGGLLAFEYSQGFLDWMDVMANAAGIIVAVGVLYLAPGVVS